MLNWYCIYTKPKHEDSVATRLGQLPDLEVFNPKLKRKKYRRLAVIDLTEQLFPSYVFVRFDTRKSHYIHMIKYTRGVKRFVGDRDGIPFTVDQAIIDYIKSRMNDGYVNLGRPKLSKGDEVRVNDGPFSGFSGIFLEEMKGRDRVLILLNSIHYQAKLVVKGEFVARAN